MKVLILALSLVVSGAWAKQPTMLDELARALQARTAKAPATGIIENAFSPDGGGEILVLKVIHASQNSIRLAAYSFTSPAVVRALIAAKKRGVDVRVVVDDRGNRAQKNIAALNLLINAHIPTRTISRYAIHHDKFIVSDARHVQTGSFNYSQAAARSNSENVLVIWNNPEVAMSYLRHWENRYDQGAAFNSTY